MKVPDGSVIEFRIGTALATVTAVLAAVEEPSPSPQAPKPPGSFESFDLPSPPAEYVQPLSPPAQVQRVAARPVELPGNLVGAVAAAQFGFWAIVGLLGWWSRPRTQGTSREWFFDTIDRVQAVDHT